MSEHWYGIFVPGQGFTLLGIAAVCVFVATHDRGVSIRALAAVAAVLDLVALTIGLHHDGLVFMRLPWGTA